MKIINIAAYKFITLAADSLPQWKELLKAKAAQCALKGTVLLSVEGINFSLAGEAYGIESFKRFLAAYSFFDDLPYKASVSKDIPFQKLIVRIKNEIITMKELDICPERETAPHLPPQVFKQWYEEGKEMVVLDTRNQFEVKIGAFESAIDLNLKSFSEFPNAVEHLPSNLKEKIIVTYCTGGIRCEKASAVLLKKGFKYVYQLDGGILNYFEQCGGSHYQGECFVFDDRGTLQPNLQETGVFVCSNCRSIEDCQCNTENQARFNYFES